MPRIISGTAKNIQLEVPENGTRPITDRAKSALFSILFDWIKNAKVLDLFAGSGSLGIEALSRGAKTAVFVDNSIQSIDCIEKNLKKSKFSKKAEIINDSVENFITNCTSEFDLIFLDPPYTDMKDNYILMSSKCLKNNGLIVIKHSPKFLVPKRIKTLKLIDQRTYGENVISFLNHK